MDRESGVVGVTKGAMQWVYLFDWGAV